MRAKGTQKRQQLIQDFRAGKLDRGQLAEKITKIQQQTEKKAIEQLTMEQQTRFEDFSRVGLINQRGTAPTPPTIIYVKYIKAAEAKAVLDEVLGLGAAAGGGGAAGGETLGGSTVQTTGEVQITAEPRLNALIVQANEMDLELIEDMLLELDRSFAPQDPKAYGETFVIPVYYMTADDVANVVKQAFPQQIYSEGSGQDRQQQQTQQFLQQMLRGGRGGRGGGGQQQAAQEQKMSIGIDPRSNSLIVTGPEHLYLRVLSLVEQLDRRGIADNEGISRAWRCRRTHWKPTWRHSRRRTRWIPRRRTRCR